MSVPIVSKVRFELSVDELQALVQLAEDQLFRVKFIDPKMPGHKADPDQIHAAEIAVARLKESLAKAKPAKRPMAASNITIPPSRKATGA
jgi:hypothetical protein